jgi:hypothetical protein
VTGGLNGEEIEEFEFQKKLFFEPLFLKENEKLISIMENALFQKNNFY